MDREEILKYAKKLFSCYQSIPKDAFINSITIESSLKRDEENNKEYCMDLHYPYGMMKQRYDENVSVTFIPVYFFKESIVGVYVSFYNVKKSSSLKVGPFKTAEELTDAIIENQAIKSMSYITGALKTDVGFINTYQNVQKQYDMKISSLPQLPLMTIIDKDSFLGPVISVATRYINNPYAFNDVVMEVIKIDGFSGAVTVHYNEPIGPGHIKLWDKFNKKKARSVITASVKKVKEMRKKEDELIKQIKEIE